MNEFHLIHLVATVSSHYPVLIPNKKYNKSKKWKRTIIYDKNT